MKSWTEISLAPLRANVAAIRAAAGDGAEVLAVIKADAYGHGAALLAPALLDCGLTWLGVADVEEGERVRRALHSHDAHIVVMCGLEPADAPAAVEHRLTPVLWTPEHVHALDQAAARAGHHLSVHLELDTGMARQGAVPGLELEQVLDALRDSCWLHLEGVFSHLSSSEVPHSSHTDAQLKRFQQSVDQLRSTPGRALLPEWIHLANSAALDENSSSSWVRHTSQVHGARVLVRPGLSLYGYSLADPENPADPPPSPGLRARLQPILTWKTRILSTRDIAPGQTVGYGATFTAAYPMRLALLPVGYADGFRREASSSLGNGWVMVAGRRAPVVGRVSMNLTVVDITHIPQAAPETEVTLLGPGVSADDHARWCHTIPYEILCGIRAHRRLVP